MKLKLPIILLLLMCLIISVHAETLTGSISAPNSLSSVNYIANNDVGTSYDTMHYLLARGIENCTGITAVSRTDDYKSGGHAIFGAGAPIYGAQADFTAHLASPSGVTLGTGEISFQRRYFANGSETIGYQTVVFNPDFTTGIVSNSLTGDVIIYLDFPDDDFQYVHIYSCPIGTTIYTNRPLGTINFGGTSGAAYESHGYFTINKRFSFGATYTLIKNESFISGNVGKVYLGYTYESQALIYDGVSGELGASEQYLSGNTFSFHNLLASSVIVGARAGNGVYYNSSILFEPVISPYTLTVYPNPASSRQVITADVAPQPNSANRISYSYTAPNNKTYPFMINDHIEADTILNDTGNWLAYNELTSAYDFDTGTTMPIPAYLNNIGGTGNYTLNCHLETGDYGVFDLSAPIVIASGGLTKATIYTQDSFNNAAIIGSHISVQEISNGNWTNKTATYGSEEFWYPISTRVNIYASANNYQTKSLLGHAIKENDNIAMLLLNNQNIGAGNLQVNVQTTPIDLFTQPINQAIVKVSNVDNPVDNFTALTNGAGSAFFTVNLSATYLIHASGAQYTSAEQIVVMNPANPQLSITLYLSYLVTPISTPTGGLVTYTPTPHPIITPNAWAGNNATCKVTLSANSTIIDSLKNSIACAGITDATGQSLALAGLIILICAFVLSRWAKGLGAIIGSIVGFVISLVMGLVPFWALVALIILIIGALAFKTLGSDK